MMSLIRVKENYSGWKVEQPRLGDISKVSSLEWNRYGAPLKMARNLSLRIKNKISVLWKLGLSVRKGDWVLRDYPIEVTELLFDPNFSGRRRKQFRFVAAILNWHLVGTGDTAQEALASLSKNFSAVKSNMLSSGRPLPRPGAHVPIEFASQERVNLHANLADDFVDRILGIGGAWISDESSLWDFHDDETNEALVAKISEVYGIDVSDLESARLSEIFERISSAREARSNS